MKLKWTSNDIPGLGGKIAVVTGANRGIGYEMVRSLSRKGARAILACRNKNIGEVAVRQIRQENPAAEVELIQLDLASLASVHRFVDEFIHQHNRLDVLINNAGVMRTPWGKTEDGFEIQFGTNHLGHFALTGLLCDLITCTPHARIVTISSWGHYFGRIDFENLNAEKKYNPSDAYAQSKLANLLFTYELQRRLESRKMDTIAVAAHPGWTATNLAIHWPMVQALTPLIGQKPEMGALPALYAATANEVHGGEYYGPDGWGGARGYPTRIHSSAYSYDTGIAAKLWVESEKLTGVQYL